MRYFSTHNHRTPFALFTLCALPAFLLFALAAPAPAQAQTASNWYGGLRLGLAFTDEISNPSSDNDVRTNCDQHLGTPSETVNDENGDAIDPLPIALTDPACARGDSWQNSFDLDEGTEFGLNIGYVWSSFRFELEYEQRRHSGGTSPLRGVTSSDGSTKDAELVIADESVTDFEADALSLNVFYDFAPHSSGWMPYIGLGVGQTDVSFHYTARFIRTTNRQTLIDNYVNPNAAGTATTASHELSDSLAHVKLMAGMDYPVTERIIPGIRLHYTMYDDDFSDGRAWDLLRGHESSIQPGGAAEDAVRYRFETGDLDTWGISFVTRYHF